MNYPIVDKNKCLRVRLNEKINLKHILNPINQILIIQLDLDDFQKIYHSKILNSFMDTDNYNL